MRQARVVRKEYRAVCDAMKKLHIRGTRHPLPKDEELYMRLSAIRNTLEWVHPKLIKTTAKGSDRFNELLSSKLPRTADEIEKIMAEAAKQRPAESKQ